MLRGKKRTAKIYHGVYSVVNYIMYIKLLYISYHVPKILSNRFRQMTAQGKPFCVDLALKPHSMAKFVAFIMPFTLSIMNFFKGNQKLDINKLNSHESVAKESKRESGKISS